MLAKKENQLSNSQAKTTIEVFKQDDDADFIEKVEQEKKLLEKKMTDDINI